MNRGLPASGKTTASMELVSQGWKRVNRDDLRIMIDNGKWSRQNEIDIMECEEDLAHIYLVRGFNVVVDDTNFAHEDKWRNIAENHGVDFTIKDFNTPVQECVRRNLLRGETVPTDAIWKMYRQYVQPKIKKVPYDKNLPDAYIFDIDGTLAHMKNRGPFEWDRVGEDSLDEPVSNILDMIVSGDMGKQHVLIVSGRDICSQMDTEKWLDNNEVCYDKIFMRPNKDMRPDTDVKCEIYENNIKGKYNILGVFDDRDSVVQLWRSLGLKCFQVEYGSF